MPPQPPEIPGFVYDPVKKRYFKITNGDTTHNAQYHNTTVQVKKRHEDTVKRVRRMSQEHKRRQLNPGLENAATRMSRQYFNYKNSLSWDSGTYKPNARKLGYWKYPDDLSSRIICRQMLFLVSFKRVGYLLHGYMTIDNQPYIVYSKFLSVRICKLQDFILLGVECKDFIHYPMKGDSQLWVNLLVKIEENYTLLKLEDSFQLIKWDFASRSPLRPFARIIASCVDKLLDWFIQNKYYCNVQTSCYHLRDIPDKTKINKLTSSLKTVGVNLKSTLMKDPPVKYIYERVHGTDCLITLQNGSISIKIGKTFFPITDKVKSIKFYDFHIINTLVGIETGHFSIVGVSDFYLMKADIEIRLKPKSKFSISTDVQLLQLLDSRLNCCRRSIDIFQSHAWIASDENLVIVNLLDFRQEALVYIGYGTEASVFVCGEASQYLIQHDTNEYTVFRIQ